MLLFGVLYIALSRSKALLLDEFIMLLTAKRPFLEGLLQTQDYSAPLYQLLLRVFAPQPHPSELVLRLPSAIAGVLCLFASWSLVKRYVNGFLAFIFLILLGLNPFFMQWATMARPYTLYGLLFVLCLYFSCATIRSYSDNKVLFFIGSSVLLCYATYIGIPVVCLFVATTALLIPERPNTSRFLKFNILTVIGLVPVLFLLSRYLLEGVPALHGDWIVRPDWLDFLVAMRFAQYFGDLYAGAIFFTFFVLGLTFYIHNETIYQRASAKDGAAYFIVKNFCEQRVIWLYISLFVFSLFFVINAISFVFPIYVARYGFPVLILLLFCFCMLIENFPRVTQYALLCIVLTLTLSHLDATFQSTRNTIILAGLKTRELAAAGLPVHLLNWKHGTDWRSPEAFGLQYYGFDVRNFRFIDLDYGNAHTKVKDDGFLKENPHGAILVYGYMRDVIADFFGKRHVPFKREGLADYTIFLY